MIRRALLTGFSVLVLTTIGPGYAAGDGPTSTEVIGTMNQYLEAFDAAYRLPAAEHDPVAMARSALHEAENWWVPRLSLHESLHGVAAGAVLDLSVAGEMLVLDSTAAPDLAVAQADMAYRTAVAAQARARATVAFLQDVVAYALLSPAAELAAATVDALEDPSEVADPLALPPSLRGEYEAAMGALDGAAWLSGAVRDVEERLAQSLSVPVSALSPPSGSEVSAYLADAVASLRLQLEEPAARPIPPTALDESVARCLSRAPAMEIAAARRALTQARNLAARASDVVLELTAGVDTSLPLASGVAGSPTSARVGLEARFVLPDSWPVAGTLSAKVNLTGLAQAAEVSWPPRASPMLSEADPTEEYAAEVTAATWDARASLRALEQASSDHQRRQRALAWAILDTYPDLSTADAARLAADPLSDEWRAAGLPLDPRPRIETVLARLGELSATLDLAGFCGTIAGPVSGSSSAG